MSSNAWKAPTPLKSNSNTTVTYSTIVITLKPAATHPAGRTRAMPNAALVMSAAAPTVTKVSPVPKAKAMLSALTVVVKLAVAHTRARLIGRRVRNGTTTISHPTFIAVTT